MTPKEDPRVHFSEHEESKDQAPNGHGTASKSSNGETLDHPVMDGASLTPEEERQVVNPWRGEEDPALVRHPEKGRASKNPYGG